ncbi:MAG TPA: efflux transporter periplasmic adaptor subunit, partial [Pseudoxanthomonas sp.]
METRDPFRIRDTSAQDHAIKPAASARRDRKPWLIGGIAAAAVIALTAWVILGWASGGSSFDASRVRVAEVTRGDLVRDLSADGRVIAANSPTLYAIAGGTVVLQVVAGDAVKKGQALAV